MVMGITLAMFEFIIWMILVAHQAGLKLEMILMVRQQKMNQAGLYLYLLMASLLPLALPAMMIMELMKAMPEYLVLDIFNVKDV